MKDREKKNPLYKGNRGQLKMAKKLGGLHLGHLYSLASGLDYVEELGWTYMDIPYKVVVEFFEVLEKDEIVDSDLFIDCVSNISNGIDVENNLVKICDLFGLSENSSVLNLIKRMITIDGFED